MRGLQNLGLRRPLDLVTPLRWLYTMCNSHESEMRAPFAQIICELRISTNCSLHTIHEFVKFMMPAPICEPSQTTTNRSADLS